MFPRHDLPARIKKIKDRRARRNTYLSDCTKSTLYPVCDIHMMMMCNKAKQAKTVDCR